MSQFYVYTLARPDGTVFYVGKGTKDRIDKHESKARSLNRGPTPDAIRAIWKAGGEVVKTKVLETDDEEAAYLEEIRLIRLYGVENLTNRLEPRRPRAKVKAPNPVVTFDLDCKTLANYQLLKAYYRTTSDNKLVSRLINEASDRLQRLGLLKTA